MNDFNPSKVVKREVIKELHTQYSQFYSGLGYVPDHLSSHFPITFLTDYLNNRHFVKKSNQLKGK